MAENYSQEQLKAFADRDLRIAREASLHAVSRLYAGDKISPNVAIEAARDFIKFIYEGMDNSDTSNSFNGTDKEKKICMKISQELGVSFTTAVDKILAKFGKLPSNEASISKVVSVLK